ncbi:protein of unknown function DUF86 [Caldicellulosiruptor acetigenus I77R1B]|jgi:uncharacterized protein YutE (UPF0331/DUF86 family)|uniref:DUF86 domain-containing protein n=1 Tax=Caldicellulosiruptor acetigenus (strain ATCC 700853 / DSM 12137 / I77R1B) TaxID=632335 RepID=E4S6W4_CALA7|nr:DUF86 domain-containing protein [Caldicellulosiruptor acetigenus]ADQ41747.1 protein of unknown function DUF86 [Caldicellulosiruptor acetigenus I77R1B]WAM36686.1 DUF86 domain-containing protein [Caldicellulosiruptor acetigenus]
MTLNIDYDKVFQKIEFIKGNLAKLNQLKKIELEDFLNDFRNTESCKYLLQTSIEAIIDICNHIIARNNLGKPSTHADAIRILVKNNIISQEIAAQLVKMVKFRNRIVHLYFEVDNLTLYDILQNNLSDFDKFIDEITGKLAQ